MNSLDINQIIVYLISASTVIGAFDRLIGNKLGLGRKFEEGFGSFGVLAVNMVGIMVLVPIIGKLTAPMIAPLYRFIGSDPAMLAGSILANDMGGYQLAKELSDSYEAVSLGGMILASMMGATVVFNIPASLGVIKKEDHPLMAKGVLFGFVSIPIGCFAGGLAAGFKALTVIRLIIPVIFFSVIVALLLWLVPNAVIKVFMVFGKLIGVAAVIGAALGVASYIAGVEIPYIASAWESAQVVLNIVLFLPGTYVFVELLSKLLKKPISFVGKRLDINETATMGLISSMANAIPTFSMIKDMDGRGKVVNYAFLVGAGYLLGDHLAFCSSVDKKLVLPMIVGKLTAGVFGVIIALIFTSKGKKRQSDCAVSEKNGLAE